MAGTGLCLLYVLVGLPAVAPALPFQDPNLSWEKRLDDLVGRLNLAEVQEQMARGGAGVLGGPAPAIPRLGVGAYSWNTECLHGDARNGRATSFPQSIGLAATFSTELLGRVSDVIGTEVRGKFNDFNKNKEYGDFHGASCFSPVINILRDHRWGRNQETYGEDPYLSGEMAVAFDLGLKGNNSRFVRATGSCKHFAAHDGPESIPVNRLSFDAKVSERDLRTTYLPAFRRCVTSGAFSVMCSYNRLNGVPACANKLLLTDILRKEWGFTGYVVSDQGAIEFIITEHHYLQTEVDTVAACVNAGCNLELGNNASKPVFSYIEEAVRQGKLNESLVRAMVRPLFYTRMRLGEFDPIANNPYSQLNSSVLLAPAHVSLSLEAAMKTFVLLKNTDGFLPLRQQKYSQIAVVGPMADNMPQTYGNYKVTYETLKDIDVSPLEGLSRLADHVTYASGCNDNACASYNSRDLQNVIQGAEVVFVCLGLGQQLEDECIDRTSLELPGSQKQLLQDAVKAANGKPVVLLMFNAGAVNIGFAQNDSHIRAILECWYPGQMAGEAIRKVLTMDGPNTVPGGRLPYTWIRDDTQLLPIVNYSMDGRTYRYSRLEPLYPFGYGLSYTTFHYSNFTCDTSIKAGDSISCHLTVTNTGNVTADEVVQVYLVWLNATVPVPIRQLVYFNRISAIQARDQKTVSITLPAERMGVWVDHQGWIVEPGDLMLYGGGQQPDQITQAPSNVLSQKVKVTGYKQLGM